MPFTNFKRLIFILAKNMILSIRNKTGGFGVICIDYITI